MKVYVSSKSNLKHEVVREVFHSIGHEIETVAVPVQSNVSEQPSSIEETYQGAENRHTAMVERIGKIAAGDCYITIESGIYVPVPKLQTYFGTTSIIIEQNSQRHIGIDSDIEFPKELTDRVPRDYKDLGTLVQAEFGAQDSDPIKYFTNGQKSRRSFMREAIMNVLIQFEDIVTRQERNGL